MARIGIDARQVTPAGKGHARSQRLLVQAFAGLGRYEVVAFVRGGEAAAILRPSGVRVEQIREPLALLWEQVGMMREARRLGLDALLTLGDRLPVLGGPRVVVWLFELPTHRMATTTGLWNRGSDVFTALLWKRSMRRAARVVAGSGATANELEEAVPALRGQVPVIYPGLGGDFSPAPRPEESRYVFHLGSADPRDNTESVVGAYRLARQRVREPVRLVIGGDLGGRTFEGIETTGRLSEADLARWYRGATAYLDATLYEGFGYQPLEAMASGAPVIASSASSIPEVVGDAGLLCDPHTPASIADALVRVLEEPGLAAAMRAKGLARAATFTWERTALEFADLLDEVVG